MAHKVFGILPVEETKGDKSFTVYADGSYKAEMPINYKISLAKRPVLLLEKDVQTRANHYLDALKDIKDKSVIKNLGGISLLPDGVVIDRIEKAFPEDSKGEGWYWTVACVLKLRPSSEEDAIIVQGAGVQIDIASTGNIMRLHSTVLPIMQPKKDEGFEILDLSDLSSNNIFREDNNQLQARGGTVNSVQNIILPKLKPLLFKHNASNGTYSPFTTTNEGDKALTRWGVKGKETVQGSKFPKSKLNLPLDEEPCKGRIIVNQLIEPINEEKNKQLGLWDITIKMDYVIVAEGSWAVNLENKILTKSAPSANEIRLESQNTYQTGFDFVEYNKIFKKGNKLIPEGLDSKKREKYDEPTLIKRPPNKSELVLLLETKEKKIFDNLSPEWKPYYELKVDYNINVSSSITNVEGKSVSPNYWEALMWVAESPYCRGIMSSVPTDLGGIKNVNDVSTLQVKLKKEYFLFLLDLYRDKIENKTIYSDVAYDDLYEDTDVKVKLDLLSVTMLDGINAPSKAKKLVTGYEYIGDFINNLSALLYTYYKSLIDPSFLVADDFSTYEGVANVGYPFNIILNPYILGKSTPPSLKNKVDKIKEKMSPTDVIVHETGHNFSSAFTHDSKTYDYSNVGLQAGQGGHERLFPTFENTIGLINYETKLVRPLLDPTMKRYIYYVE